MSQCPSIVIPSERSESRDFAFLNSELMSLPLFPSKIASVLLFLAILFLGCNSRTDKHTLIVSGAVHVYPTDTPPTAYPGTSFIEVLGPKDHVKVRGVEYKNGYMAVKVRLDDGREGWVFSGESIELK